MSSAKIVDGNKINIGSSNNYELASSPAGCAGPKSAQGSPGPAWHAVNYYLQGINLEQVKTKNKDNYVFYGAFSSLPTKEVVRQGFSTDTLAISVLNDSRYYLPNKSEITATISNVYLQYPKKRKAIVQFTCKPDFITDMDTDRRWLCSYSPAKGYKITKVITYYLKPKANGESNYYSIMTGLTKAEKNNTKLYDLIYSYKPAPYCGQ
ncbi:MAG: hypothetical protein IT292_04300 [Deltaproteobacteria bacterium]|nr:hypothetical protein [Deltaproteobacteria bacterium]